MSDNTEEEDDLNVSRIGPLRDIKSRAAWTGSVANHTLASNFSINNSASNIIPLGNSKVLQEPDTASTSSLISEMPQAWADSTSQLDSQPLLNSTMPASILSHTPMRTNSQTTTMKEFSKKPRGLTLNTRSASVMESSEPKSAHPSRQTANEFDPPPPPRDLNFKESFDPPKSAHPNRKVSLSVNIKVSNKTSAFEPPAAPRDIGRGFSDKLFETAKPLTVEEAMALRPVSVTSSNASTPEPSKEKGSSDKEASPLPEKPRRVRGLTLNTKSSSFSDSSTSTPKSAHPKKEFEEKEPPKPRVRGLTLKTGRPNLGQDAPGTQKDSTVSTPTSTSRPRGMTIKAGARPILVGLNDTPSTPKESSSPTPPRRKQSILSLKTDKVDEPEVDDTPMAPTDTSASFNYAKGRKKSFLVMNTKAGSGSQTDLPPMAPTDGIAPDLFRRKQSVVLNEMPSAPISASATPPIKKERKKSVLVLQTGKLSKDTEGLPTAPVEQKAPDLTKKKLTKSSNTGSNSSLNSEGGYQSPKDSSSSRRSSNVRKSSIVDSKKKGKVPKGKVKVKGKPKIKGPNPVDSGSNSESSSRGDSQDLSQNVSMANFHEKVSLGLEHSHINIGSDESVDELVSNDISVVDLVNPLTESRIESEEEEEDFMPKVRGNTVTILPPNLQMAAILKSGGHPKTLERHDRPVSAIDTRIESVEKQGGNLFNWGKLLESDLNTKLYGWKGKPTFTRTHSRPKTAPPIAFTPAYRVPNPMDKISEPDEIVLISNQARRTDDNVDHIRKLTKAYIKNLNQTSTLLSPAESETNLQDTADGLTVDSLDPSRLSRRKSQVVEDTPYSEPLFIEPDQDVDVTKLYKKLDKLVAEQALFSSQWLQMELEMKVYQTEIDHLNEIADTSTSVGTQLLKELWTMTETMKTEGISNPKDIEFLDHLESMFNKKQSNQRRSPSFLSSSH